MDRPVTDLSPVTFGGFSWLCFTPFLAHPYLSRRLYITPSDGFRKTARDDDGDDNMAPFTNTSSPPGLSLVFNLPSVL